VSDGNDRILDRLFSLKGRTALITGASGGIGRGLAVAFAEAGATVGVHGMNVEHLEETRRQVEAVGGRAVVLRADLKTVEACQKLIADAVAALGGRLDVLVNNAGMNRRRPIAEATPDDFDTIVAVNLRGPYFLAQAAHAVMKTDGGGKVINIGSITSTNALGGVSVYGATKAGLAQLTMTMAVEWARDNVQVNCLCPGFIRTPLTEQSVWGDPKRKKWLLDRIPARRAGTPDDLVGTALLMASAASNYLTGQVITVDGGYHAGGWWDE
jgi:NAD(P)-dependent dehydrogenase (short-subunit alcohol dehydrogenase family)